MTATIQTLTPPQPDYPGLPLGRKTADELPVRLRQSPLPRIGPNGYIHHGELPEIEPNQRAPVLISPRRSAFISTQLVGDRVRENTTERAKAGPTHQIWHVRRKGTNVGSNVTLTSSYHCPLPEVA